MSDGREHPVLIVEDDEATAELEARALRRAGRPARCVGSLAEAMTELRSERFSAVVLDYMLPDGKAWPVFEAAQAALPSIPVIVVTALGDERIAADVLHRGGADYIIKTGDFWRQLPETVERVLLVAETNEMIARLASIVESSDDAIVGMDLNGDIATWNAGAERMYGYGASELVGRPISLLFPEDTAVVPSTLLERIARGERFAQLDTMHVKSDGSRIAVALSLSPVLDDQARPIAISAIARDITERKRAEQRLIEEANLASLAAEVGVIQTRGDPDTLRACAQAIVNHLDAAFARIWTLNADDQVLELKASAGMYTHIDGQHARVPVGALKIGLIAEERRAHLTNDVSTDPRVSDHEWAKREGIVSFAGYPLMVEGDLVGVMAMFARHTLSQFTLQALEIVADTIALGIRRQLAEEIQGKLQHQLRQAQKMEAVGQLAGGIAHDFNNLLTVVLGYCDLLRRKLGPADSRVADVEEIMKAAEAAATLTHQLLAFSRRQVLQPRILDLNEVVTNVERMVARVIGEDIDIRMVIDPAIGRIEVDPGQVEQVLMNLVINARDAMPKGGRLLIQTENVAFDGGGGILRDDIKPGSYVMVAVSDTGIGMDAETKARIFEPFFTTKEPGKGTGLGLATVYGIVKQSGGHVWVYSEPGGGSTFKVYFPRVGSERASEEVASVSSRVTRGTETILVIEDERMVRNLTVEILREYGYDVLAAASGEEAATLCEAHGGRIHLLLTDLVMPGGSGQEWAKRLVVIRPDMKVLYMSGYTDTATTERGLPALNNAYLQKPFTAVGLTRKVREIIDL